MVERRARSKTASQRDVTRTRIILMAADDESNVAVGQAVGMHYRHVDVMQRGDSLDRPVALQVRSDLVPVAAVQRAHILDHGSVVVVRDALEQKSRLSWRHLEEPGFFI